MDNKPKWNGQTDKLDTDTRQQRIKNITINGWDFYSQNRNKAIICEWRLLSHVRLLVVDLYEIFKLLLLSTVVVLLSL